MNPHRAHSLRSNGREQVGMGGEQKAQWDRKRDHSLPHRHPGDDVIDQVHGRCCHGRVPQLEGGRPVRGT